MRNALFVGLAGFLWISVASSDNIGKCLSEILADNDGEFVIVFKDLGDFDHSWSQEPAMIQTQVGIWVPFLGKILLVNGKLLFQIERQEMKRYAKADRIYIFMKGPLREAFKIRWSPAKFVVVVGDRSEVKEILLEFWKRRIFDVIVMIMGTLEMFTYFPYSTTHCEGVGEPVLLGTCASGAAYPDKVKNMHGCPLIVSLVERSPAVVNSGGKQPEGVEPYIIRMIAAHINATPVFYFLKNKIRLYKNRGNSVYLELLEKHSHLVAGSLVYTRSSQEYTEGMEYQVSMCVTVAVPRVTSPSYAYIFSKIIPWKMLLAMAVAKGLSLRTTYAGKERVYRSRRPGKTVGEKVLLTAGLLSSFWIHLFFEAFVSSSVLLRQSVPQPESLEDVLRSSLLLDGDSFLMQEVLQEYIPRSRYNTVCGCPTTKALTLMAEEADRAFVDIKFNLAYNLAQIPDIWSKVHVQERCITTFRPVIQMRKRSPFFHHLNRFLLSLSESGVILKAFDSYNQTLVRRRPTLQMIRPLTLNDFRGSFFLFAIGCALSLLSFGAELLCFKLSFTQHYLPRKIYLNYLGTLWKPKIVLSVSVISESIRNSPSFPKTLALPSCSNYCNK